MWFHKAGVFIACTITTSKAQLAAAHKHHNAPTHVTSGCHPGRHARLQLPTVAAFNKASGQLHISQCELSVSACCWGASVYEASNTPTMYPLDISCSTLTPHTFPSVLLYPILVSITCSGDKDPLDSIMLYDAASSTIVGKASTGINRPATFCSRRVSVLV